MRVKALAAAGIVALSVLSTAGVANADFSNCNKGNVCLWNLNDFHYMIKERDGGQAKITNLYKVANKASSWANRSYWKGCGYGGEFGRGDRILLGAYSKDRDMPPWSDNEISSWRTKRGC